MNEVPSLRMSDMRCMRLRNLSSPFILFLTDPNAPISLAKLSLYMWTQSWSPRERLAYHGNTLGGG